MFVVCVALMYTFLLRNDAGNASAGHEDAGDAARRLITQGTQRTQENMVMVKQKKKMDDIAHLTQSLKDTLAEAIACKQRGNKDAYPLLLHKGSNVLLDLKRLAGLFILYT